jgi:hypothetical protein
VFEIKRRIAAVDRAMMVRTNKHKIRKRVITSATEPTDMMRFAKLSAVTASWCPLTDLAFTRVKLS